MTNSIHTLERQLYEQSRFGWGAYVFLKYSSESGELANPSDLSGAKSMVWNLLPEDLQAKIREIKKLEKTD